MKENGTLITIPPFKIISSSRSSINSKPGSSNNKIQNFDDDENLDCSISNLISSTAKLQNESDLLQKSQKEKYLYLKSLENTIESVNII